MASLEAMSSKLQKLDTLENITNTLQHEVSRGNARIEEVSECVNAVKNDLTKYDTKWQAIPNSMNTRLSLLEKRTQSWENKLEQSRETTANAFKVVQMGIDSNSKKALEFENFLKKSEKKWESLHRLENKIKQATKRKFNELKDLIKAEVREELQQEVQAGRLQIITPDDLKNIEEGLRKGIMEVVKAAKATEVTREDLQKNKDEVINLVQSNNRELLGKISPQKETSPEKPKYSRLKEQAYAGRLNIIIFGIKDNNSMEGG